jgi:mevalonate kinase
MSEFVWTPEDNKTTNGEKSLQFSFTQQLGRLATPIRSQANARAAGKVILVGEHAVVYGARAIAIPLLSKSMNLRIYTDRVLTNTPKVKFQIAGKPVNEQLIAMVSEAFEVLGVTPFNVSIDGFSSLMLGAGVGSSASLCVSLLRGLSQLCGISLTPARLSQLANRLERRFHGNPSGLDTSVVSLEQAILFERGRDAEALLIERPKSSNLPWCFTLLDTGVRSPTINMVRKAEPWFKANGSVVISQFNEITNTAALALREGEFSSLADALSHGHRLLKDAGVVTEPVSDVVETALQHGAAAAKVTGAGGGGCVLALIPSAACDPIIAALRKDLGADRVHPIFIP